MTLDLAMVLALLAAAILMFVLNRPRMDVVALIMIAALPLTGVLTIGEAIAGFADSNIVLIAVLFVLGESLVRTGVARRLGDWINATAGGSETRLLVLLMVSVAGLGSMMSSTAVVAIFIPVVLRICQSTGQSPSKLMMPMSAAALVSGMLTLVATAPNLVVNAELVRQGFDGFNFFSVTVFGLPVLAVAVGYMLLTRSWLPATVGESTGERRRPTFREWIEKYELRGREHRVRVAQDSPLIGRRLEDLDLRAAGVNLIALERPAGRSPEIIRPTARTELCPGDILLLDVRTSEAEARALIEKYRVEPLLLSGAGVYFSDRAQDLGMVEAIVPAESPLVGRSVLQARVRAESGLTVIGLRRGQQVIAEDLLEQTLKVGDTLLLTGFWKDIRRQQQDGHDLVMLDMPAEFDEVLPAARQAPWALAILALVIGLMVFEVVPNVHAVLLGCLLLGLFRCVDMASAYRSINWPSLVLIVGMMPFSLALQRTGGVDLAAEGLLALVGEGSPRVVLGAIFLITALLGMFISNTATAILMAPVALAVAIDLGASPYPFAMTVALAASTAFMTPVSSPVNTLVVGPGNYVFADFVKIGVPLSILVMIVCVLLVPIVLPL